jgi:DNA polymerase III subunit delta
MADQMLPAYLIAGSDESKIDATRRRLRVRAEAEGGAAALEVFEPSEGRGAPDAAALLAAIPTMSLTCSQRYLLVDGVERWRKADQEAVIAALAGLPPDLSIVFIAHGKVPAPLAKAVRGAGGEVLEFEAPRARDLPRTLVADAEKRGFRLAPDAARLLVLHMGANPVRLVRELDRLALWAGPGGEVGLSDLEAMVADTSEAAVWSLSDAVIERDRASALAIAERLVSQGENVTGLVYGIASRLRKAHAAASALERGESAAKVERSMEMHPYAAKQLVSRAAATTTEDLRRAIAALADLEVWCRGGADYGDELALSLALRRAVPA